MQLRLNRKIKSLVQILLRYAESQSLKGLWLSQWGMRDLLRANGFNEAIIGITEVKGERVFAYDYEKCVQVLRRDDNMTREEAIEYMDFNVAGSYVGVKTPVFVHLGSVEEEE